MQFVRLSIECRPIPYLPLESKPQKPQATHLRMIHKTGSDKYPARPISIILLQLNNQLH